MRMIVVGLILVAAVFSAYAQVRKNGFVDFDDPMYVTGCRQVQQGVTMDGIWWAFTNVDAANWHPLTWISHMVDCELFGKNAGMHHLVNVGLHAVNAVLVLACLMMLTGAFWPSAAAALVWAVHPLRVESVAWISERKDLLSACFGLLCIMAHVWYARRPSLGRASMVWLTLALGLMCKPMLVTWPFLLLVLDFWPLRRWKGRGATARTDVGDMAIPQYRLMQLILEKGPMFALCAASCVITVHAQRAGGAMIDTTQIALWPRVANAIVAYANYVIDLFWPRDLALLYPHPQHRPMGSVIAAACLLAVISGACIGLRRCQPWLLVGWLWFLGTLVPVIGLVQVGAQSMADRYTYLPHIGLLVALAMLVHRMVDGGGPRIAFIALVASIPLWFQTRAQVLVWRDTTTLYEHTLSVTTDNWMIHNNMGVAAMGRNQLDAAETHYREALRIRPDNAIMLANFAEIMARRNNYAEAIHSLSQANASDPDNLDIVSNLAVLLVTVPNPVLRDPVRAVELALHLHRNADVDSISYPAYMESVGLCYASAGRYDDAAAAAQAALAAVGPDTPLARELRERLESNLKRYQKRQTPL